MQHGDREPRAERQAACQRGLSTKPRLLAVGKTLNTGDLTHTDVDVALTGYV